MSSSHVSSHVIRHVILSEAKEPYTGSWLLRFAQDDNDNMTHGQSARAGAGTGCPGACGAPRRNFAATQERKSSMISYTVGITSSVSRVDVMTPYARTPYPSRRIAAIPAAGPSASTGNASRHPATSTSAGII